MTIIYLNNLGFYIPKNSDIDMGEIEDDDDDGVMAEAVSADDVNDVQDYILDPHTDPLDGDMLNLEEREKLSVLTEDDKFLRTRLSVEKAAVDKLGKAIPKGRNNFHTMLRFTFTFTCLYTQLLAHSRPLYTNIFVCANCISRIHQK